MNTKMINTVFILLLLMVLLPYGYAEAGINVSPDRHVIFVRPGEEETVMYHIDNSGDEDIDVIIEPKAWSGPKDPYEWLSLESDNVYVKAGESTPIVVGLRAPEGAEGEMVAMLFLCYKDSAESQLNIRNGVPLYLVVKGTESYSLEIEDISVLYGKKGHFHFLDFAVTIRNTGNVHIVPDVSLIVRNDKGRVLNTLSLKKPNIVLREKKQTYRLGWRDPDLREGIYTAEAILDYEDKIEAETKEARFQVAGSKIEKMDELNTGE